MLTVREVAEFLRAHDNYLILTHKSPDGDTLGCAAALCHMLRGAGKTAWLLKNDEVVAFYAPYVEGLWAADDYAPETVVSVDLAALGLFPKNAEPYRDRVDLAIDHHPSYEGFGKRSCVHPECAACGEILYEIAVELGQVTKEVALPLYVAVATDTGCFVYTNVTANTHRVAAALIDTGIDFRAANKRHFRTKTKKRLALEARLFETMEFFDDERIVVVQLPLSLQKELALTENDTDDLSALGGLVEGTDCSITMKEKESGEWKISVRTGARVNATKVCEKFGGGGHKAASGCVIKGLTQEETKRAIVAAAMEVAEDA
jgi:phosphoesterase RecJ-like protein